VNIYSVLGIAIVSTVICILMKQYKPEYAMLVSLACGLVIFSMILVSLMPVFEAMRNLIQRASINSEYTKAIIKTLGVCYVTQLASDSCRDAGQTAIASKVELCGKVFIVIISLPLFENLVDIAFKLINTSFS
jgi:stage III sporulation protein AD